MSASTIAEANVLIRIPMAGVKKGLAAVKGMLSKFNTSAGSLVAWGAAGTASLGAVGIGLVKLASDANEMNSKLDATWKDQAAGIKTFADAYAQHIGRSKQEVRKFTTDSGAFLKSLGFGTADAAKMSKAVAALAYDLGSFENIGDQEALDKLLSGLSGEAEPLKKFAGVINETAVNAQLLTMGIAGGSQAASEQQKVMARLNLILANTKDKQGDAFNTSQGVANSWKALTGQAMDLGAEIGTSLLPIAKELIEAFKLIVGGVGGISSGFLAVGGSGTQMLSSLVEGFKSVMLALMNWDLTTKIVGLTMYKTIGDAWGRVKWFGSNVPTLLVWLYDNWVHIFTDIATFQYTILKNSFANIVSVFSNLPGLIAGTTRWDKVWTPMLDGFKTSIKKMPEFSKFVGEDITKDLKDIDKEYDKRLSKLNKPKTIEANAAIDNVYSDVGGMNITDYNDPSKKKKDKKEGTFTDIASIFKNAQEGLSKAKENKVQTDQLLAQQKTATITEKVAGYLDTLVKKASAAMVVPT